jgi:protein kinase-like protein
VDRIGPYPVVRELGRGGAAIVYEVRGPGGASFALKLLLRSDESNLARFQRELESMTSLASEGGFVEVLDAGVSPQGAYLVMPYLQGGTLEERLRRGALQVPDVIDLGQSLSRALGRAHGLGLIHRDLKPANVIFDSAGGALIADLGLAKAMDDSDGGLSKTGELRGTLGYAAPEQLRDSKRAGPQADVFALGATLYHCLAGRSPFGNDLGALELMERGAESLIAARPEAPAWLASLIEVCLRYDPDERPSNGSEVAEAFRTRTAPRVSAPGAPRRRGWALAVVLILVAVLGAVGIYFAARHETTSRADPTSAPPAAMLRRARSIPSLRAWIEKHSEQAKPRELEMARRRLAELAWRALPRLSEMREPRPNDLARVRRQRALWAWAGEHLQQASARVRVEARSQLNSLRGSGRILARLSNREGSERSRLHGRSEVSFLANGGIEVYGGPLQTSLFGSGGIERVEWLPLGEPILRVRPDREGAWALVSGKVGLRSKGEVSSLALRDGLTAKDMLVLGERLVVVGEARSRNRSGFLAVLSKADLREGLLTQEVITTPSICRSLAAHPNGKWVYLSGGGVDVTARDGFVARIDVARLEKASGGEAKLESGVFLEAAGTVVDVSPDGSRLAVGLSRGGASTWPLGEDGEIDSTRRLKLVPESKGGPLQRVSLQCRGLLFLPRGDLVMNHTNYAKADKIGFLSAFDPTSLEAEEGKTSSPPSWNLEFVGATGRLLVSQDRSLLGLGGGQRALILPTPWDAASGSLPKAAGQR